LFEALLKVVVVWSRCYGGMVLPEVAALSGFDVVMVDVAEEFSEQGFGED
jgi:uncharacterized protein (UPF0264 family)